MCSAQFCVRGGLVPASYGIVNAANENGADSSGKPESEKTIIERWTWDTGLEEETGDLIVWSDENQRWEVAFPGANEENPVTEKHLKELLPGGILAETEDVAVSYTHLDVYKRQILVFVAVCWAFQEKGIHAALILCCTGIALFIVGKKSVCPDRVSIEQMEVCLLYTSMGRCMQPTARAERDAAGCRKNIWKHVIVRQRSRTDSGR